MVVFHNGAPGRLDIEPIRLMRLWAKISAAFPRRMVGSSEKVTMSQTPFDPQRADAPHQAAHDQSSSQPRTVAHVLAAYALGERNFAYWNLAGADLEERNAQRCELLSCEFARGRPERGRSHSLQLFPSDSDWCETARRQCQPASFDGAVTFGADLTDVITDRPSSQETRQNTASAPAATVTTATQPATATPAARFCAFCGASMPAEGSFCAVRGKQQPGVASAAQTSITQSPLPPPQNTQPVTHPQSFMSSYGSPPAAARSAAQRSSSQSATGTDVVMFIGGLIGDGWNLIVRIAIVILVIVGIVAFVKSCAANATLNEHSSCQQFQQADADTQDKVLQDMMTAHHDQGSIDTTRFSLALYCNIKGGNAPIDGIYSSGYVGQSFVRPLRDVDPLMAFV